MCTGRASTYRTTLHAFRSSRETVTSASSGRVRSTTQSRISRNKASGSKPGLWRETAPAGRGLAFTSATRTAACSNSSRTANGDVLLEHNGRVAGADTVDERGEAIREVGVLDLEHVLGVALAGTREIEATEEDEVVGHRDLRVHEVVYAPFGLPRIRRLG